MSLLSAARHTWLPGSLLAAAALTGAAAHSLSWGKDKALLSTTVAADQPPAPAGALDPKEFKAFKLIKKEKLTHNTLLYRFELPKGQVAGLNTASCLVTKAVLPSDKPDEPPKPVIRPYTPTSAPDAKGYLDLVVKVYPTGKMSKHIDSLKIGDSLEMKGPIPKWPYKPNVKKQIGMVAGGTGITPMLQVIDAIVANPADKTQVSLVYANVSEEDIILKDKLDAITKKHKNIKVHYIVDKASSKHWKGGVGFVTKDVLKAHIPPPSDDHIVFVCGPPGMMEAVSGGKNPKDYSQGELKGALKDLGYTPEQVFKF